MASACNFCVTSWDQPRIRVRAEKTVERTDESDAKRALAELRVEMTPRDGGLSVRTILPKQNKSGFRDFMFGNFTDANVRYDVSVPRNIHDELDGTALAPRDNQRRRRHRPPADDERRDLDSRAVAGCRDVRAAASAFSTTRAGGIRFAESMR